VDIDAFLSTERASDEEWTFELGQELHGAFGGAFGGIVAVCVLRAARGVAPGRVPAALDCRFVRGLPAGGARVRAEVVHAGRSLSCVSADVFDGDGRMATRATVSLVDPSALSDVKRPGPRPPAVWESFDDARPWPPVAPIVSLLRARSVGSGDWGIASAALVPWDGHDASAEAACLPGDLCVGPPVAMSMSGESVSHPNPDLSLRFCGAVTTPVVVGVGRTERAEGGVAVVGITVWSGEQLVAVGSSFSLLLTTG
jgi:acyl-coenzyme A thioesterase PaaI-like protein